MYILKVIFFSLCALWGVIGIARAESALHALGKASNEEYEELKKLKSDDPAQIKAIHDRVYSKFKELDRKETQKRYVDYIAAVNKLGNNLNDDLSAELAKNPSLAKSNGFDGDEDLDAKTPESKLQKPATLSNAKPQDTATAVRAPSAQKKTSAKEEIVSGGAAGASSINFSNKN